MKLNKRVLSLIMAVVMVLSLCTVAFATDSTSTTYEKPKRSSSVDSISGISSVTVNTATAAYYRDNNTGTSDESPVYIRATVAGTDYNLAAATVVITTTGNEPTVKLGDTTISKTSSSGNA